jgi:hypothetical protein
MPGARIHEGHMEISGLIPLKMLYSLQSCTGNDLAQRFLTKQVHLFAKILQKMIVPLKNQVRKIPLKESEEDE